MIGPEQKLAEIVAAILSAGIDVLVMGGHAVRYYGVTRNTVDFDLVASLASADELGPKLFGISQLGPLREEPVWRRGDFARFEIGKLESGREEWLEFWVRNHLLSDFATMKGRAEMGRYGGATLPFLSLPDLIRSKETERESDWQDIALLEEIQDARLIASASRPNCTSGERARILSGIRSRKGMERAIQIGLTDDRAWIDRAIAEAAHPVTIAFLRPRSNVNPPSGARIEPALLDALSRVPFGSVKHFSILEVVRRAYKRNAIEIDRADKQRQLQQSHSPPVR